MFAAVLSSGALMLVALAWRSRAEERRRLRHLDAWDRWVDQAFRG